MRYTHDLTDAEWQFLQDCFPKPSPTGRPRQHAYRELLNAMFCVVRTTCQWRDLPKDFAPWATVYHYFRRWKRTGLWVQIHTPLRERVRQAAGRHRQPSAADSDQFGHLFQKYSDSVPGYSDSCRSVATLWPDCYTGVRIGSRFSCLPSPLFRSAATCLPGRAFGSASTQSEQTRPSPNGVAPTWAGLPNSSSRLRSCAWVPFGGGRVCGRIPGTQMR